MCAAEIASRFASAEGRLPDAEFLVPRPCNDFNDDLLMQSGRPADASAFPVRIREPDALQEQKIPRQLNGRASPPQAD
jgi:hypothetical protein